MSYLRGMERLREIKEMEVINLEDNTCVKIKDLYLLCEFPVVFPRCLFPKQGICGILILVGIPTRIMGGHGVC